MICTTVETFTYMTIYNLFLGGCKIVVEIIIITENMIDFGDGMVSEEEEPYDEVSLRESKKK